MGEGMKPIFLELSNFLVQHLHGCGIVLSAGDKMMEKRKMENRRQTLRLSAGGSF
jgi:hypothetical protein